MKIEYDHQADAVYLSLTSRKAKVWKSREVEPGVVIDLDRDRRVLGIEILEASRRFKPREMFQFSVKHVGETVAAMA